MQILTGQIIYKTFAEGTKSECQRPFVFLENGSQILLYKTEDNPFENNAFAAFENKKVQLTGEFCEGVFNVSEISQIQESDETESSDVTEAVEAPDLEEEEE